MSSPCATCRIEPVLAVEVTLPSRLPSLSESAFARAFPFYLHVDADMCVCSAGASLCKAYPAVRPGAPLQALFLTRRPRSVSSIEGWRAHIGQTCTLMAVGPQPLMLRGSPEICDDGSLLLLVSPVLTSMTEVTRFGLGLNDFARHDATADSLLLAQTGRISAKDAEHLAANLRMRTEQLGAILELSENGVAYFDPRAVLLHVNTAFLKTLNLDRLAVFDLSIDALDDWIGGLLAASKTCRRPLASLMGGRAGSEAGLMLALERPRPAVIQLVSKCTNDGGRVFYLRDRTRESEVDRMKSEFLATAAHELRTPMVSVHGFTELLLNREVSEDQRRDMLEIIHRQSELLINVVNDMLDLARIEARQGEDLKRTPYRLGVLVEQAAAPFFQLDGAERLRLRMAHADTLLHVDAEKTLRAVTNVLSNALKYTPDGGAVTVDTLDGTLRDAPAVGLRVTDCGIGMTPAQQARVFERFYRADPSGNIPGTGLGMSLVKEIVELHGGRVEVESETGRGTTVTLWLPIVPAPAEA